MVGGRSLGCRTCKKRRIKCDERSPVCLNCEKSLRKCTGPLSPFIDEGSTWRAKMQTVRPGKESANLKPDLIAETSRKSTPQPSNSLDLATHQNAVIQTPPNPRDPRAGSMQDFHVGPSAVACITLPMPMSHSELLSVELDHTLRSTEGTGSGLSYLADFLPSVPCRIGHNTALDAAIECILLAHQGIVNPHLTDEASRLRKYGLALHALRTELNSTDASATPETVCAALTICTCELMNGETGTHPAWLTHAGGGSALLKAWGPEGITSDFAHVLLYSHSAQMIASCLIEGTDCFLDQPRWQSLLQISGQLANPENRLSGLILASYAMLPALVRDVKAQQDRPDGVSKEVLYRAWALRKRLFKIQPEVDAIFSNASVIQEVACSSDEEYPFETCLWYSSIVIAQTLSMYWRLVIAINRLLHHISSSISPAGSSHDAQLRASSLAAAEQLLKSVEYSRAWRPLGSAHLLIGLPFAYSVYAGSLRIQRWILRVIDELSERLDAMGRGILMRYINALEVNQDARIQEDDFSTLRRVVLETTPDL